MAIISDEYMKEILPKSKTYSLVILKSTSKRKEPGVEGIVWEHVRRNFSLRADGLLRIVCPVADGTDISGIGIFNSSVDETTKIMNSDPGVQAGLFVFEVHPCRGFPGDCLA